MTTSLPSAQTMLTLSNVGGGDGTATIRELRLNKEGVTRPLWQCFH